MATSKGSYSVLNECIFIATMQAHREVRGWTEWHLAHRIKDLYPDGYAPGAMIQRLERRIHPDPAVRIKGTRLRSHLARQIAAVFGTSVTEMMSCPDDLRAPFVAMVAEDRQLRRAEKNARAAAAFERRLTPDTSRFVYFVHAPEANAVKIGVSSDPKYRLTNMQVGSPVSLTILAVVPGGHALERKLHQQLAASRIRGEWFRVSPGLLEYITSLNEAST